MLPGDNVEEKLAETIRGACGAIVLYSPVEMLLVDLGTIAAREIPMFVIAPPDTDSNQILRISGPQITVVEFDPSTEDDATWQALQMQIEHWLPSLPRPNSIGTDILSAGEQRAIEAFLTAFYRRLDANETGLAGGGLQTAQIHIETLNLQNPGAGAKPWRDQGDYQGAGNHPRRGRRQLPVRPAAPHPLARGPPHRFSRGLDLNVKAEERW
jgi:hypothetical protein